MHQSHMAVEVKMIFFLTVHWTANEKKVIQILYIRLWYSTIQYELIAYKK